MTNSVVLAVLSGVCGGMGLWFIALAATRLRVRSLELRVAPWIADVNPAAYRLVSERVTINVGWMPLRGILASSVSLWQRLRPGTADLDTALRQLGSSENAFDQRAREVLVATVTSAVAVAALIVATATSALTDSAGSPPREAVVSGWAWLVVPVVAALIGGMCARSLFQRRVKCRVAELVAELPAAMEFLALALTAGESFASAFRRVSRLGDGSLAHELRGVQAQVEAGRPLTSALDGWIRELRVATLTRVFSQVLTAYERGTPMSAVLREQAAELRHDKRNRLVELAARKEVAMLIPLVFIILPTTVIFAVYPGLVAIQTGFAG